MSGMRVTIYLMEDLKRAGQKRGDALGYSSFSAYVQGLIRADLVTLPSHALPLRIAGLGEHQRDKIDAAMLEHAGTLPLMIDEAESLADDVIDIARAYRQGRSHALPAKQQPVVPDYDRRMRSR